MNTNDTDDIPSDVPIDGLFWAVEAEETKALRAWLFKVNQHLHGEEIIDKDDRKELDDLASRATGWDGVE